MSQPEFACGNRACVSTGFAATSRPVIVAGAQKGTDVAEQQKGIDAAHRRVIFASSLGTVFEWYDFYLYGSLVAIITKKFFSGMNDTTAFLFALLAFAAGFFVRPFGALVFGRLGDLVGRKYTFLITIVIMGASTALVGCLPTYETIGVAAPIIFIALRLLQGLALGGQYGGAATYIAEHAPPGKRGLYTSWIQTTATLGFFLSLLVILACRSFMAREHFEDRGWRVPFLLSTVLLADLRVHPAAVAGIAGVPGDEVRGQAVEGAADRVVRQSGRISRSCCWPCSAPPPARPSSGTAASSTRCCSSRRRCRSIRRARSS